MELKNTEKQEHSVVALTIEITKAEFEAAKDKAFKKTGKNITVPGFRKGKAPRKMIEKLYGEGVFFEEAFNIIYPDAMEMAVEKSGIKPVGRADVDLGDPAEEGGLTIIAKVPVEPEVELGEYKGIEVEKETVKVLQADVKAELNRMAQRNARTETVERKAKKNDTVDIDFEGFVDGVPFEGGKAEHHELTLGSGAFIPGFEDQLIGCKAGDEKDVVVTFPEEYHAAELKGKPAVFKCTVNEIKVKELPEADDEFAKDVSEFDTLAEYKDDIRAKLLEKKTADAKREKQNKTVAKAVENATMEIPEAMITEQVRRMADDFARRLQSQGLSMDQYMQFTGLTMDALAQQMRPEALKRIQNSLVLEAIAKAENIEVSDEKVNEEIEKMAAAYKMEADKLKELIGDAEKEQMKSDLAIQAAVDMITDAAVEVEAAKEEEKTEE